MIGLIGGIGAGKTSVARMLEALGAFVIDSDQLAREVFAEPDVMAELRSCWGDTVVSDNGSIDRAALADIVFADPQALKRLEDLIYPRIELRRCALMKAHADARVFVWDAPKLVEAGLATQCDRILFVDADRSVRLQRLQASRGWDEKELSRREKNQSPLEHKRQLADYVVENNSTLEDLRFHLERVFSSIEASLA